MKTTKTHIKKLKGFQPKIKFRKDRIVINVKLSILFRDFSTHTIPKYEMKGYFIYSKAHFHLLDLLYHSQGKNYSGFVIELRHLSRGLDFRDLGRDGPSNRQTFAI